MSMRSHLLAAVAALGVVFLPSSQGVSAQTIHPGIQPAWTMPQGQGPVMERVQARVLPLRQLIGIVSSQRPGNFVDVVGGLEQRGDRAFYTFRWRYPNGQEVNLRVDASSGAVIG